MIFRHKTKICFAKLENLRRKIVNSASQNRKFRVRRGKNTETKNVWPCNVPEVENDNVEMSKLMKNLGLENIDVNIIGRVGAKVEGKIRNLKFNVNNFGNKTKILTNSKKLRECEGHRNIYVHSDLTQLQQVAGKNLRVELRRRKEYGETNLRREARLSPFKFNSIQINAHNLLHRVGFQMHIYIAQMI